MASLKCGICGNGIHYHDEADGTQLLFIKSSEWNRLLKSNIFISRYLLDGTEEYCYAWKCNKCGSLIMLDPISWHVINKYAPSDNRKKMPPNSEEYVVFDDITWDKITENRILGADLKTKHPKLTITKAFIGKNSIITCCNEDPNAITSSYTAIKASSVTTD